MSTIEVKAQIDDEERFEFSGSDLEPALRLLHGYMLGQVDKLRATLDPKTASEIPTMHDLRKPNVESTTKQQIRLALSDAFTAQIWASECARTPKATWRLTMSRLKWLYRQHQPT